MSTEMGKKKIEIGAVIDFCRAKGFKISKTEIFRFFSILQRTGNNWFPGTGSSNAGQPQQPGVRNGPGSLSNSAELPSSAKRKNPVRNGGRDRKHLKSMIEDMLEIPDDYGSPPPLSPPSSAKSSSSSIPGVPITPSRRRNARPFKKSGGRDDHQAKDEPIVDIKSEDYNSEFMV